MHGPEDVRGSREGIDRRRLGIFQNPLLLCIPASRFGVVGRDPAIHRSEERDQGGEHHDQTGGQENQGDASGRAGAEPRRQRRGVLG